MIRELVDVGETRTLEADVCIIGSGAAGLCLAAEFLESDIRVLVLESGGNAPGLFGAQLNELDNIGLRHDGATEGRVRAFGGTTLAWGGQLVPLRASEVEARPWVSHSGWPIDLEALQPYYRRVESILGVEGPPYDGAVWNRLRIPTPRFDEDAFCVRFSQWARLARRNFAVMLRRRLASSRNVTVLLDATATRIHGESSGTHTEQIEVRSRTGRMVFVKAAAFVVACGGIETARLLLASPGPGEQTIANRSGLVGRFFQDHVSYAAAEVYPLSRAGLQRLFDPRYLSATMFTAKIEPTDGLQRKHELLNAMGHLAFRIPETLGLLEVRQLLRSVQAGKFRMPSLDQLGTMLRGGGQLARMVFARLFLARRLSPSSGAIALLVDVEQAPNPHSRITLTDTVDALGVRRAQLDWKLTEQEPQTLLVYARLLARELERLGLGVVRMADPPDFSRRDEPSAARDIFHHMGTARMSRSPSEGVTDCDLRCHDIDNLFIASSAVFPTSGVANPTFTLLALTLRLADHLKARVLRRPRSVGA